MDLEAPVEPVVTRTCSEWGWMILIFGGNIIGQAMQNICLPIALSSTDPHPDMAVVLVYMCFTYFIFFSVLDIVLDLVPNRVTVPLSQGELLTVGVHNTLNGIGAIFGGSSSRTPLTMQMSGSLALNLLAPFYKMWLFGLSAHPAKFKGYPSLIMSALLYTAAFVLTLVDKLNNVSSGSLSPFCILFWMGVIFGVTYNIHQEKMMVLPFHQHRLRTLSSIDHFCIGVSVLRHQLTWLFMFSWAAVLLDLVPGFGQTQLTQRSFLDSWSAFLPFSNVAMNLFNLGYVLAFISSIFLNRYDSSFNMITSNISAVLCLWTGWAPTLRDDTTGFTPSVPLTVVAIILSLAAIYPSYRYSVVMRHHMKQHSQDQLRQGLLTQ